MGARIRFAIVQVVTLSRVAATLVFISIAFQPEYRGVTLYVYGYAILSDLLDGALARHWNCSSLGGGALDRFSDKYLTSTSVLYAAALGVSLLPCAIILIRNVLVQSLREVIVDGRGLILPERTVGALTAGPIWVVTGVMISLGTERPISPALDGMFWALATGTTGSVCYSIWCDRKRLRRAFDPAEPPT